MQRSNIESIIDAYPEISGVHPACSAVPPIGEEDFKALSENIRDNGLRHDIILTKDGKLVDGRNRLLCCYEHQKEPRFKYVSTDPWAVAFGENIARRHLTAGQRAMFAQAWWQSQERPKAEQRRKEHGGTAPGRKKNTSGKFTGSDSTGDSRDQAGNRAGVSGRAVEQARTVQQYAPELADEVKSGETSLNQAYRTANQRKKSSELHPSESSNQKGTSGTSAPTPQKATPQAAKPTPQATTRIITTDGKEKVISKPKSTTFNRTNNSVDWASWTWNPVTGCKHGCKFCYAREIAYSQRMADYYPFQFEPTLHEYRLEAPKHTKVPNTDQKRDGRVFVCSMADLFGKWVPDEWIQKVFDACIESPEWEYLFLTKWPARYAQMPLLKSAWYGASVVKQADVKRVESAMQDFEVGDRVRWVSMEPMVEPVTYTDLSWCDLMVIGAQTSTTQPDGFVPAFSPHFDWVVDVVNQCREAGVPYYLKENLGLMHPGMNLPKSQPRKQ